MSASKAGGQQAGVPAKKKNWTRQRHGQQADHEDNRGSKCVGQRAGHASLGEGAEGWTVTFNED